MGGYRFATNVDRVAHQKELDDAIEAWTNTLTSEEVLAKANEAQVPNGKLRLIQTTLMLVRSCSRSCAVTCARTPT